MLIVVAALTMAYVQVQAQQSVASKIIFYKFMVAGSKTIILVGHCLATKVFIGKLPATRGVWLIIG